VDKSIIRTRRQFKDSYANPNGDVWKHKQLLRRKQDSQEIQVCENNQIVNISARSRQIRVAAAKQSSNF